MARLKARRNHKPESQGRGPRGREPVEPVADTEPTPALVLPHGYENGARRGYEAGYADGSQYVIRFNPASRVSDGALVWHGPGQWTWSPGRFPSTPEITILIGDHGVFANLTTDDGLPAGRVHIILFDALSEPIDPDTDITIRLDFFNRTVPEAAPPESTTR